MRLFSRWFRPVAPATPAAPPLDPSTKSAEVTAREDALRVVAIGELPDGDVLRRLAAAGSSPILQRAAVARIGTLLEEGGIQDPAVLAQLAGDGPSSRLRQLAADKLGDPEQLAVLIKRVRNRDKNVYKILRQKVDAQNAATRRSAEAAGESNALCTLLERQAERPYDVYYTTAFEQLEMRWRAQGTGPSADVELRALRAIDRCRDVIAAHLRDADEQAGRLDAERAAQQLAREANERNRRETDEAAAARADIDARARQEAADLRETEARQRAQRSAEENQLVRQIEALIRRAQGALADGDTKRSAGVRRALDEKLSGVPMLPAHVSRQVQVLDDKLLELKQWKDYAVAPKRLELIDEMESLVGSTEEPTLLADRIKALQQDWRTISQGIVSDTPAEWERFHKASQAAYRPCSEYFEAQAKLRQENLQGRMAVLERLTAFEAALSQENPDWRLLTSVLREAPREWRAHFPVDRDAGRRIQASFDASLKRLQSMLDGWYASNVAQKQSLIDRARPLLTLEDSREAIDAVKRLQMLWKETGPAPRERDRALWGEFREICDAIFARRQQAHTEFTAGLEASKATAVTLCEAAERIGGLSGAALAEGAATLPDLRVAFDALGELPRADARGLHDRFQRALERCKAQMADQRACDAERSVADMFEAVRHVQAYEWAFTTELDPPAREALRRAAESFIAAVPHWPKGGLMAVKDALARAGTPSAGAAEARETALRILCIRCEIQSGLPTPPEDEALRREFQVQRLMQGMGQGARADSGDWDALFLEWIRIGAISPAVQESLRRRFLRGRGGS